MVWRSGIPVNATRFGYTDVSIRTIPPGRVASSERNTGGISIFERAPGFDVLGAFDVGQRMIAKHCPCIDGYDRVERRRSESRRNSA